MGNVNIACTIVVYIMPEAVNKKPICIITIITLVDFTVIVSNHSPKMVRQFRAIHQDILRLGTERCLFNNRETEGYLFVLNLSLIFTHMQLIEMYKNRLYNGKYLIQYFN
jgi:hypothetical protein